jgi:hypothetical protein
MQTGEPLARGLREPGTWIGFDLETTELEPGAGIPSGITCAAAGTPDGTVGHWYGREPDGRPIPTMGGPQALGMLRWLRHWQLAGHRLVAWNGAGFDLHLLGVVSGCPQLAADVMWEAYDPMLQVLWQRGFPVGLARAAEGLALAVGKSMAGAQAPAAWLRGEHAAVLAYVAGDVRMTLAVTEAIEARGELRWVTRRGRVAVEPMPALRPVRELLALPPPDQSWMREPMPPDGPVAWARAQVVAVGAGA